MIPPLRSCACLLILGCLTQSPAALPDGYDQIFTGPHASPEVSASANDLADLLARSYGRRPEIRRAPLFLSPTGIHIGPDPANPAFDDDPLTDEILIERSRRGLEIRGSDNTTTRFAIYRFAEAFLGWRYFQPGEIGLERLDHPPDAPAVRGSPEILLLTRAAFFSRNPSSLGAADTKLPDWSIWHGLRERFQYNHTLHRVVPPTRFDNNPDWFSKDAVGNPVRPPYYPQVNGYNDHPDLSNQELREYVARKTLESIAQVGATSPGILSVSLSLGDSFVFGNFPEDYPWKPDQYFRRWPDWSNHVFAYTNWVAARVSQKWKEGTWRGRSRPGLYLGALAYLNWENVPDFSLHPAIVPYLTFDRSQWYDPDAREDDLRNVSAWNKIGAPFLGTWDYLFGYGFIIPRSMTRIVADSIPALYSRGVRAYFCQVAATWPYDGHVNGLLARLLWDPEASSAALLDEYFSEFYGPAAVPMRAFFDQAESIWMNQEGSGWWLRYWKDPWQIALYRTEDLAAMEKNLDQARRKVSRPPASRPGSGLAISRFAERVEQTRLAFQLTKALHNYQTAVWKLQTADRTDVTTNEITRRKSALVAAQDALLGSSINVAHAEDLNWVFRYDQPADGPDGLREPVLYDTDFSEFDNPLIWHKQFMDSKGMRFGRLERRGMFAENVRRGHVYQLFRAVPGEFYLGLVDLETRQSPSGEIYIKLDFFDADHKLLIESSRARISPTRDYGERQEVKALMQAPVGSSYGRLFIRFYEMDQGSRVEVNEAAVFHLTGRKTP